MQTALPDYHVGLMHGSLSSEEKEAVMEELSTNNVQLLVSTTVVEVGVNVPNATVMVIYDAERFGLAHFINFAVVLDVEMSSPIACC